MITTSKKLIVGFDMDGVILDNAKNKIEVAGRFGIDLRPEDTPADRIVRVVPEIILGQMRPILYDDPEMALRAETIPGATAGLRRVRDSGLPYFLISRRKNWAMAVRSLERHGLWPELFNQQNTFFVFEPEDKDERARSLGINFYVDDQVSVLEKLVSVEKRVLFDQFRQFGRPSFPHHSVASWDELLSHIF